MNEEEQAQPDSPPSRRWLKLLFVIIGLALWYGTQYLISKRMPTGDQAQIVDLPLQWTEPVNRYLNQHKTAADALLVVSSFLIDCLGIFLLGWSIFGPSIRPFLGLLILFALRQTCQGLIALPAPEGMIWHVGPTLFGVKVPTLLVTYGVANDLFFSGHTAMAVYGAVELGRLGRRWLVAVAVVIAAFQMGVVIVLRAHWTMDVFAGAVTALVAAYLAAQLAPRCDRLLARRGIV
jgi:membrane-associated phospholipid phosphatase